MFQPAPGTDQKPLERAGQERMRSSQTVRAVVVLGLTGLLIVGIVAYPSVVSGPKGLVTAESSNDARSSSHGRRRNQEETTTTSDHNPHSPCRPGENGSENLYRKGPDASLPSVRGRGATTACVDGKAAGYACHNVDLEGFLSLSDLDAWAFEANDVWGWTDVEDGNKEYALIGLDNGVGFVDISTPTDPTVVGLLPTHTVSSGWRDIKTYKDHAFVVSEAYGHGVQVYNMKNLKDLDGDSVSRLEETAHHGNWNAHNIFINEESGYAYVVGSSQCSGGLYMLDVSDPSNPEFAGCYSDQGYTHDVQCVNYSSDDPDGENYGEREICFASNENMLVIVDVTNKSRPVLLSQFCYKGSDYTHQGWLTDDRRFFLLDDESDDIGVTVTFVVNVVNLKIPYLYETYYGTSKATDHNQYVLNGYAYQANYRAGLRILDLGYVAEDGDDDGNGPELTEVAYFDVYKDDDDFGYNGAWSVFPFYESGRVVVSGIEQGLYVLTPRLGADARTAVDDFVTLHVADVVAEKERRFFRSNGDAALVTVMVHDQNEEPVPGVNVVGLWDNLGLATTCVTDNDGRCTVTGKSQGGIVPFRVVNLSKTGPYRYDKSANVVPDPQGNGSRIVDMAMAKNIVKNMVRIGLGQ